MKRLLMVLLVVVGAASAAWAQDTDKTKRKSVPEKPTARVGKSARKTAVKEPEVVRETDLADLTPPVRVRVQLRYGRPIVGRLIRVDETHLTLDTSAEPEGLPGKFRFKRADVVKVWELSAQTESERTANRTAGLQHIEVMRSERAEAMTKRKAEQTAREETETAKQEDLKKALDNVVGEEQETAMRALLAEFPPEQWTEAIYNELRDNWRLRDLAPDAKQARFLSIYPDWRQARDTIRILDAKKNAETGDDLLLRFPTSAGWGRARLDAINVKTAGGGKLADEETAFKDNYALWEQSVLRQAQKIAAEETAAEKPPAQE